MEALEQEEYIIIRVNGGKMKSQDELQLELNESLTLKQVVKLACKKFDSKESSKVAKVYNKNGVLLFDSDFNLISHGDILYIALKGEDFNHSAILDEYEQGKTLGVGGFGRVVLGRHLETRAEVAIKFTDVGDQLSSANLIQAIYKEAESLKALQHKHIVKLYHAFIEGK